MDTTDDQMPVSPMPEPPEEAKSPQPANYPPPVKEKLSSSQKISIVALMLPLLALPAALMLALSPVQLFKKAAENLATPPIVTSTPAPQTGTRVFVTSTTYNGNLGGLTGADAKCQERANIANLGGAWKAWLSTNQDSPSSRFSHALTPYITLDNKTIANNWTDLTDGSLQNLPTLTELKMNYYGLVWTGTNYNGSFIPGSGDASHCLNWTSNSSSQKELGLGAAGNNQVNYYWTTINISLFPLSSFGCNNSYALYCFEQPSVPTPTPVATSTPAPSCSSCWSSLNLCKTSCKQSCVKIVSMSEIQRLCGKNSNLKQAYYSCCNTVPKVSLIPTPAPTNKNLY